MIHGPLKCIHFTWQINLFHAKQLFTKTTMVWICLHSRVNSKLSLFINISVVFCLPFHFFSVVPEKWTQLTFPFCHLFKKNEQRTVHFSYLSFSIRTFHRDSLHFSSRFRYPHRVFSFISYCNNRIFLCQMYLNYEVKRKNTVCLRIDDGLLIKEHR